MKELIKHLFVSHLLKPGLPFKCCISLPVMVLFQSLVCGFLSDYGNDDDTTTFCTQES